ncbi:MAG: hypothetical protein ABGX10_07045 [Paracoccus sp. (in: a-proteobacteria)]
MTLLIQGTQVKTEGNISAHHLYARYALRGHSVMYQSGIRAD